MLGLVTTCLSVAMTGVAVVTTVTSAVIHVVIHVSIATVQIGYDYIRHRHVQLAVPPPQSVEATTSSTGPLPPPLSLSKDVPD